MRAKTVEWRRHGAWAAHLFVDGAQACTTMHGQFPGFSPAEPKPVTELAACGLPFGKVCQRCTKVWKERR